MANRYEKLCLAALKDLKVEVEWIVWIVGKVIRFMIRLFSLCCPSQWSCPTSKGIRQHYLIWRPEEVTKMDKWEDFDQIEADRLLAEQMQAQMTSSESEESGRSGQTSKIILCINVPKFLTKQSQFFLSMYICTRGHCSHLRSWWETECGFH